MSTGIYTPVGGTTPEAQAQENLRQTLAQLTSMPSADLSNQAYSAQLNQPAVEQQAQQGLTQQSGIPQLQSGQQDLGKIFSMYLADHGLSQKYMNTNDTNPYTSPVLAAGMSGNGQIGGAPNPYLNATPEQIAASTQPSAGSMPTPALNTAAMGVVPKSTTDLLDMLQTAVGGQQGLVNSKMGDVSKNYQAKMGVLQSLIDAATKREEAARAKKNRQVVKLDNGTTVVVDLDTGKVVEDLGGSTGGTSAFGQKLNLEAQGYIDSLRNKISWSNLGAIGKVTSLIPGTPEYNFAQEVEGLKGNLRVTTLLALKASGGTMGQLSNEEGRALESAIGKLDIGMSPDAFKAQLDKIENYVQKASMPANGASTTTGSNPVKLTDPKTGNIYQYSGVNDPDYIADKQKGWK